MQPFQTVTGRFVALDRANVDTDQIMPARYLKRIERTGYGEFLFTDIAKKAGARDPAFALDQPAAAGATILVGRQNFGCGSSREHAVWGLAQAGFRAVIAPRVGETPGFADIFRGNAYKNGLLPVEVSADFVEKLMSAGTGEVTIDLPSETVTAHLPDGDVSEPFEVSAGAKQMLLGGLDEIGLTLAHDDTIAAFERTHPTTAPLAVN